MQKFKHKVSKLFDKKSPAGAGEQAAADYGEKKVKKKSSFFGRKEPDLESPPAERPDPFLEWRASPETERSYEQQKAARESSASTLVGGAPQRSSEDKISRYSSSLKAAIRSSTGTGKERISSENRDVILKPKATMEKGKGKERAVPPPVRLGKSETEVEQDIRTESQKEKCGKGKKRVRFVGGLKNQGPRFFRTATSTSVAPMPKYPPPPPPPPLIQLPGFHPDFFKFEKPIGPQPPRPPTPDPLDPETIALMRDPKVRKCFTTKHRESMQCMASSSKKSVHVNERESIEHPLGFIYSHHSKQIEQYEANKEGKWQVVQRVSAGSAGHVGKNPGTLWRDEYGGLHWVEDI